MSGIQQIEPENGKTTGMHLRVLAWLREHVLGKVTVSLITAMVVGLSAVATTWFFSRSADVRYTIGEFSSYDAETGVVTVTIDNKGSAFAEDVDCEVQVAGAELKHLTCEPSFMKATTAIAEDKKRAVVTIPRLNANEKLTITITATNPFQFMKSMKFAGRGKNTSVSKDTDTFATSLITSFIWSVVLPSIFVLIGWSALRSYALAYVERESMKLFQFRNGPLAGRYVAWPDSKRLYDNMTRKRTMLEVDGMIYFAMSKTESNNFFVFEMVCNDPVTATKDIPEVGAELRQTSQAHLL